VLVFIHGGGFCIGTGSEAWYNGEELAREQNLLVVTLNYRLHALGFLVTDESSVAGDGNGGMNGIRDQIEALKWIKSNVASFGGDPSQVTINTQIHTT
jgi:para-nitrobenzyl esterase